MNTAQYYIERI